MASDLEHGNASTPMLPRQDVAGTIASATGRFAPPQLDADGNLRVAVTGGAIVGTDNLSQVGGTAVAVNSGASSAGTQRVVLATESIPPTAAAIGTAVAAPTAAAIAAAIATPVAKTLTVVTKAVTTAGTGVPLVAAETFARKVYLNARKATGANTGMVYIGTSAVDMTNDQQMALAPGDAISIDPGPGCKIDLATIYIDCATGNTDGVTGFYIPV